MIAASAIFTDSQVIRINVKADPSRFRDKLVQVDGTVTTSFGVLSVGAYEIENETGEIIVITSHGLLSEGARARIQGTVFSGVTMVARRSPSLSGISKHEFQRELAQRGSASFMG